GRSANAGMRRRSDRSTISDFAQILMDELHGHRSFADSRGHSFDRTVPHIADGKYTWNVGFEQERISFKRPSLGPLAVSYQVGTRQYKAAFVAQNNIGKPFRSWQRTDKDEHGRGGHRLNLIRVGA